MALELYTVGVIVEDMPRAVEFYRRLGLAVPNEAEGGEHVEIPVGGMTFFLSTKDGERAVGSGTHRALARRLPHRPSSPTSGPARRSTRGTRS